MVGVVMLQHRKPDREPLRVTCLERTTLHTRQRPFVRFQEIVAWLQYNLLVLMLCKCNILSINLLLFI